MTEQEFRQMLAAQLFSEPVRIELDSTHRVDVHQHPYDACALIEEGEFTLEVHGTPTTYRAGDTFQLSAGTPHSEFAGPEGARFLSGRRQV